MDVNDRIVYLDSDIVVTGSLWHLFELPAVHFAATGLGYLAAPGDATSLSRGRG